MKKMNGLIDVLLRILSFSAIKTSNDEFKKVENRSSVKDFLSFSVSRIFPAFFKDFLL